MKKEIRKRFCLSVCLLTAFALWTAVVCFVNPAPIGPNGSVVGFAAVNGFVHNLTGVHMTLYTITDWLGLVPVGFILGFGLLGLTQWIKRKSIIKVDYSILVLGGFYIVVLAAYLFFEAFVVNYRPVLIQDVLEASYPSSTTMLVMCVMPTAILQLKHRIRNAVLRHVVISLIIVFILFMVLGRFLSGVHWVTDIIGGALLSTGLVTLYDAVCRLKE